MPSMIKVEGQLWAIKQVDKVDGDNRLTGDTECNQRTIYVLKSLSPYAKADVILHEVQHAFTCDFGEVHNEKFNNDGTDKEFDGHKGIYWATIRWHKFLRDNPEFLKYVMDSDPPDPCTELPALPGCSPQR